MKKEIQPKKACTKCKVVKPLNEYGNRTEAYDSRESRCKDCTRADQRMRMRARRTQPKIKPTYTFGAEHININLRSKQP